MVLVGGEMALAGWSNGRLGRLRVLCIVPPLTWEQRLCLPYGTFCVDREQALRGLAAFHRQGPAYEALMPGHGPVVLGGARGKVLAFLEKSGVRYRDLGRE